MLAFPTRVCSWHARNCRLTRECSQNHSTANLICTFSVCFKFCQLVQSRALKRLKCKWNRLSCHVDLSLIHEPGERKEWDGGLPTEFQWLKIIFFNATFGILLFSSSNSHFVFIAVSYMTFIKCGLTTPTIEFRFLGSRCVTTHVTASHAGNRQTGTRDYFYSVDLYFFELGKNLALSL